LNYFLKVFQTTLMINTIIII